jgi:hypothetical protein
MLSRRGVTKAKKLVPPLLKRWALLLMPLSVMLSAPPRQAVDGAVARGHALLRARRQQRKGQRAAARQRQVLQIFLIHRIGDGVGGRLQDSPFALHFDGLGDGADFYNHSLIGRARRVDDDASVNCRFEPLLADGQCVTARRQRRKDKAAVGVGRGGQDGFSVFIL